MALRSYSNDYLRNREIMALREDMNVILRELFSRDENVRLSSLRSFSALRGLSERESSENITRLNLFTTMVNSLVTTQTHYAEVYPKLNAYGEFPREFDRPRRMEEFLAMEVTTVDYILQSYNLPRDLDTLRRPDSLLSSSLLSRNRLGFGNTLSLGGGLNDRHRLNRDQKLLILFEYLGVNTSSELLGGVTGRLGLNEVGNGRFGGGLGGGLSGGSLLGSGFGGRGLTG